MKHLFNIRLASMAVALAFAGATFTACEDDIEITNGSSTNPWGELDGTFGSVRSAAGAKMGTTLTLKNNTDATGHVYFELSKSSDQETQVSFKIDENALNTYNTANGTSYKMYPGVTLENGGKTTIPAGKRKSELLEVTIPAGETGSNYAVAISATANNGTTIASNNASYVYLIKPIQIPTYTRDIKNLLYVEVNNENILNAGEYVMDGEPFFDIVSIFAANINLDKEGSPYISLNAQTAFVLQNAEKLIRPLQEKGIKVHLSILGNHDDAGMRSLSSEGAKAFAKELKAYRDIYGLDGFDFDDEYSSYAENKYKGSSSAVVPSANECTPENYTNLLKECRKEMPKEDGVAFGIYWYTANDHPKGEEVENLIDYTVFGSYGRFNDYTGQSISKEIQAPYAITLWSEDNGNLSIVSVSNDNLNKVVNEGYKYFAFYNLKASRMYEYYFNQVAEKLWNKDVTWTGKYYGRTDFIANQSSTPKYESYLGKWTVTPGAGLYAYHEGETYKWWDWTKDPAPAFDITITEDVAGKSYKVYGWDGKDITKELPFILNYNEDGTALCPSPQTIGDIEGTNYAMARATYSGRNWTANTTVNDAAFVLEASVDGEKLYMCDSGRRYGFSLFSIDGANKMTSPDNIKDPHSCGTYTLTRKIN